MTDISVIKMIISVAVWRIYPSWVNDKLLAWEGLGHSGMFWARLLRDDFRSKLENISFLSRVMSVSKSFLFPALLKNLAPNVQALGLWFRWCLGGLFENSAPSPGMFLRTPTTTTSIFWEFLSFSKAEPVLLAWQLWQSPAWAKHFGDGTLKTRMKLDFRALARSSAEGPSIVLAIGTSRVRWSMVQKRKKHKEVSVWLCEVSTLHHLQTSEFWEACFRDPVSLPFSHFVVFVVVDVKLQDGQAAAQGKRRKAVIRDTSGVDHWGVTNLSAPIWFTGQGHCTVFRHVMQLSLLVLCWKSTLTVILPKIKKKRSLQTLATGVKLKTWPGTERVKPNLRISRTFFYFSHFGTF